MIKNKLGFRSFQTSLFLCFLLTFPETPLVGHDTSMKSTLVSQDTLAVRKTGDISCCPGATSLCFTAMGQPTWRFDKIHETFSNTFSSIFLIFPRWNDKYRKKWENIHFISWLDRQFNKKSIKPPDPWSATWVFGHSFLNFNRAMPF